ncbi:malto-oligosyltrehalose trehalohydrolase [Granulicella cerasi]|uniref:Malto-oligosyltrehalose trehalohydrolase n=1 Tax=Granulicella cerasi TaxID=741063 RepID=A0ABW1Z6Y6_9BACT|nr:malto-oligosyltrehalose trehalohydrolase [Granulicella cerasi]
MHKFGVWAPKAQKMSVRVGDQTLPMQGQNRRGWWTLEVDCNCGDRYAYLIDDDTTPYPDPRALRQPDGVHGMSELYDHSRFEWHDQLWRGSPKSGAIIYEMHIGTFSEEGTFAGAIKHLDYLADLGVTHLELLPVNQFAGDRGWGYDGVSLFAVQESYGGPDGLKRFVDAAHAKGLSVIMDVVYNHFGPVGNYTTKFAPYLTDRHRTPWGDAVNLDGAGSDEVRRFFCDNALMWLKDYHIDGLRLDAVHAFIDHSAEHFLEQVSEEVERLGATLGREFYLIAESDLNDPKIIRPKEAHGYGMDSQWSDDFHHSLFTLLYQNPKEAGYYSDFGSMADLHKALKHAFVYDGGYSGYRQRRHGRPVEALSAHHFVHFDQNHDQVGNRAFGERIEHLIGMDAAKVAIGIVLMAPYIPMLFMGEEWATSAPFLYFADHEDEDMRRAVAEGRKNEFADFGYGGDVPNPEDMSTFNDSKLRWQEIGEGKHAEMLAWTKSLIALRRSSVCLNDGNMHRLRVSSDDVNLWLMMQRDEFRIMVNMGNAPWNLQLLDGEDLALSSREGLAVDNGWIVLPPMSLIVLQSSTEEVEDREVAARPA